ncbi:hypothetical protein LSH36_133g05076 [Paralvinella palmiformis]|uniref:EGF-like domain-containing protein n=1 Tax=Paralvinella palmiformis TaxID=53620 RepID=A0AAD9JW66_9ANNE|nr:hypothetical protein LSH36_133g05076 [Paralvinella palmiformis]
MICHTAHSRFKDKCIHNVLTPKGKHLLPDAEISQNVTPCLHNSTCLPTNNHPYYKCICPSWCYGGPCDNCYSIPGVLADDMNLILPGLILKAPLGIKDYKYGFGDHRGNEWIPLLTTNSSYRVRFDLVTYKRSWAYAEYSYFQIGKEDDGYRLNVSDYSGTAGK